MTRPRWTTRTAVYRRAMLGLTEVFVWCDGKEIAAESNAPWWGWRVRDGGKWLGHGFEMTERAARRAALACARKERGQ